MPDPPLVSARWSTSECAKSAADGVSDRSKGGDRLIGLPTPVGILPIDLAEVPLRDISFSSETGRALASFPKGALLWARCSLSRDARGTFPSLPNGAKVCTGVLLTVVALAERYGSVVANGGLLGPVEFGPAVDTLSGPCTDIDRGGLS